MSCHIRRCQVKGLSSPNILSNGRRGRKGKELTYCIAVGSMVPLSGNKAFTIHIMEKREKIRERQRRVLIPSASRNPPHCIACPFYNDAESALRQTSQNLHELTWDGTKIRNHGEWLPRQWLRGASSPVPESQEKLIRRHSGTATLPAFFT